VREDEAEAFLKLSRQLRAMRRRTGASSWRLYRDADEPNMLVESFRLGSWAGHELQHARVSPADQELLDQLELLLSPGRSRTVHHYLAAR
jgi:quinol monooxygenase YgiN